MQQRCCVGNPVTAARVRDKADHVPLRLRRFDFATQHQHSIKEWIRLVVVLLEGLDDSPLYLVIFMKSRRAQGP